MLFKIRNRNHVFLMNYTVLVSIQVSCILPSVVAKRATLLRFVLLFEHVSLSWEELFANAISRPSQFSRMPAHSERCLTWH